MRILILGEGPTDFGRTRNDNSLESEGVLPILVRKLLHEKAADRDIEFRAVQWSKAARLFGRKEPHKMGPSKEGYAKKLRALLGLSLGRSADAIVGVVDRDGEKHKSRIRDLNEGRDALQGNGKRCAVGVAIEEIEAWLLADEKALQDALGGAAIPRQPDPESLSSRNEASDNNPKGRLERLMRNALGRKITGDEFPDLYARIALIMETAKLETRCPLGFCPFAEQVRELVT